MIKHLDLFSGYGGFTIAHKDFEIETVGFSEIDKYASSVLKYNFPKIKNYGDIKEIRGNMFSQIDLITAGSPCQDLSIAGKRAGLGGARSGLFMEFIRLLKECKPKYYIWENVKGALSSNGGRDFARVVFEMEQAGYTLQYKVLNAKDYEVPQNRERIFMVGIRGGSGREVLFEERDSKQALKYIGTTGHRKQLRDGDKSLSSNSSQGDRVYGINGTSSSLSANGGGQGAKTGLYAIPVALRNRGEGKKVEYNNTGNANSITTVQSDSMVQVPDASYCLDANYYKGTSYEQYKKKGRRQLIEEGFRVRRLTPLECERLMGLEDNWTAKGLIGGKEVSTSNTQRYKMCGNGVCIPCVRSIYNNLSLLK